MQRAAIVVVGGAATRLGGAPKPWLQVSGRPIIDHILEAARPFASSIIIVGACPSDWVPPFPVQRTIEQPAGSGPAHAVRAGMALLDDAVDEVLLLAGDAPFISDALAALTAAHCVGDGAAAEHDGVLQFLLARVRRAALADALAAGGASMRSVFDRLQIEPIAAAVVDADTWEDVARLRAGEGIVADRAWLDEVVELIGIDAQIDVDALLSLTRDVAHNVERKNAPLTSYLVGYAAAARQLTPAQIAELCERIAAAARERREHA